MKYMCNNNNDNNDDNKIDNNNDNSNDSNVFEICMKFLVPNQWVCQLLNLFVLDN